MGTFKVDPSQITVITSICGSYDGLIDDQNTGGSKFIAFVDEPQWSKTWEIREASKLFASPRRNSRIHKLLIHQYCATQYCIWIDGNLRLLDSPKQLIERHLEHHDLAAFRHPTRDCIYQEAIACASLGFEKPEVLSEQVTTYEMEGYPHHRGLTENNVLFRRITPQVEEFDNAWFADYSRFSQRDQISFMPCVDRVGIRLNVINETWNTSTRITRGGIEFCKGHLKPRT